MRNALISIFALTLSAGLLGQQLEPNSSGGSATVNTSGPSGVGNPINIGSNQAIDLAVGGNANAPYIMLYGTLAATSIPQGSQFVDIDLTTFRVLVDGLNLNLAPGAAPSIFGKLDNTGVSNWSLPLNSGALGLQLCFQGATLDPASSIGFNITGAPELLVTSPVTRFTGDDTLFHFTAAAPVTLYGHSSTSISVSTNGWLSLTSAATNADLSETTADFLNGTAGGAPAGSAPVVACLWEDLDMGNGTPGQEVIIAEPAPGVLRVTWANGDHFPAVAFGTMSCTIDSAAQTVVFNYSAYNNATPATEGIVGVSDGGVVVGTTAAERDLATGGTVSGYGGSPTESVFQNFGPGSPFSEAFDLGGLTLTFQDAGLGAWVIF